MQLCLQDEATVYKHMIQQLCDFGAEHRAQSAGTNARKERKRDGLARHFPSVSWSNRKMSLSTLSAVNVNLWGPTRSATGPLQWMKKKKMSRWDERRDYHKWCTWQQPWKRRGKSKIKPGWMKTSEYAADFRTALPFSIQIFKGNSSTCSIADVLHNLPTQCV